MRTTTIEQILGPVAEAIGEFILANEEAEINEVPLPDLYPAAEGISLSSKGLIAIATGMIDTVQDEEFAIEMPLAIHELESAGEDLMVTTLALRDDSMNTVLRQQMINNAKGILAGTSRVLEAFDDHEIRKIVKSCRTAREQVKEMGAIASMDRLVDIVQPACLSLITLGQLADNRIQELLEPWARVSLTEARDSINGSTTILVSSSKAWVMNMDKESARESRDLCVSKLLKAIDEIERIVQIKQGPGYAEYQFPEGKTYRNRATIQDSLFDIHQAVLNRDPVALEAALARMHPASKEILDNALAVAKNADPARRAEILATVERIRQLEKELEAAAKYALEHPEDLEAQRRLVELLKQLDKEYAKLEGLVNEAVAEEASIHLRALEDHNNPDSTLGKLYSSAKAGDQAGVVKYGKEMEEENRKLRDASNRIADACRDPEAARAVRTAQQNLDDLLPQVIAAAKTVALNPDDPNAIEHLDTIIGEWESGVAKLKLAMDNAQNSEDIIAAQSKALRDELDKFENACRMQNAAQLKEASQGVTARVQRVIEVANKEIENSTDPVYQTELKGQIGALQSVLPELQQAAKGAFSKPNDAAAQAALKQTTDKLQKSVDTIQKTVYDHHNPNAELKWNEVEQQLANMSLEAELARAEAELNAQAEEELAGEEVLALSAEEAAANPIKAAAYSLKNEASKWDESNNPMVQTSNKLADLMAQLNDFAKAGSKKDLINTAKRIAEEVKAIEAEARRVAESCTDKRLKKELLTVCDRIPTMATQLKILATVKAANPDDNDNEQMLILCATNLMDSVKQTMNASQAAEIRSMKTVATVGLAAVRWKRKLAKSKDAKAQSLASMVTSAAKPPPTSAPAPAAAPAPKAAAAAVSAFSSKPSPAAVASKPSPAVASKPAPAAASASSAGTNPAQRTTIGTKPAFGKPSFNKK